MITFISEEQLKKKIIYHENQYIPEKEFESFSPNQYIERYGTSGDTIAYLKKIKLLTEYISTLLKTYQTIIKENEFKMRQEHEAAEIFDKYGKDLETRMFNDELYGELNYKEKLASIRINTGKKVYNELIDILKTPLADKEIKSLIEETKERRKNLPEKNKSYGYYNSIHPEEDDIYFYFLLDSKNKIEEVIPKYFTADSYYTNTGASCFVLKPEEYLYIAGTTRGKIKEFPKFHYYRDSYNCHFFESLKNDLYSIIQKTEVTLAPYSIILNDKNNLAEKKSKIKKNDYLLANSSYKKICEYLDQADIIFEFLLQENYLEYNKKKHILIKTDSFPDYCIYYLLHDDDLPFHSKFRLLHKDYNSLFGKDINSIRINKTSSAKWYESKKIIQNHLKNSSE